jgi:hypothetical protein
MWAGMRIVHDIKNKMKVTKAVRNGNIVTVVLNFSITRKEVDTAFLQLFKQNKAEETSVSGPMSAQEAKFFLIFS